MPTIESLLSTSIQQLQGVSDTADLDVEVMLCSVLEKNRSYLRAWPEKQLDNTHLAQFLNLLEQRKQGKPIAYILGKREFWSREFNVSCDVLIPRPETETLIELCLQLIQYKPNAKLIDLGTGSGIIAITLAAECPQLKVTAVDNSAKALQIAEQNAQLNKISTIRFLQSNWLTQVAHEKFDFIVSNPPYIEPNDPHLKQGDLCYEPKSALIAPQQGLQDICLISEQSRNNLNNGGYLILEHGYNQKHSVNIILQQLNYQHIHCLNDLSGQPRISYAQWFTPN